MKAINSLRIVLSVFILGGFLTSSISLFAQCPTDLLYGKNLVKNGTFSNDTVGWKFDTGTSSGGYRYFPGTSVAPGYSVPGDLFVGTNPKAQFNPGGFDTYGDHTTGSGKFLFVDGQCSNGIDNGKRVWYQTVTVIPGKSYYFSVWISSLKNMDPSAGPPPTPGYPGNLNFHINDGAGYDNDLGNDILAPAKGGATASNGTQTGGGWIQYETPQWIAPAGVTSIVISIQNNNKENCSDQVDFGLDDIEFIQGCGYGSLTPQPNLGPDLSFCGKGGSVTLNSGITPASDMNITWYDGSGSSIIGLGAPYTKAVTGPGTYYVCVTKTGSCTKLDTVVITNTFSVNTGGPYSLCSSSSQTLDAGFTGIGTTYKWYKGGILVPYPNDTKTYTTTSPGSYRVDVTVPGCGTQSSTSIITSTAPVTPIDAYYCANTGAVSGLTLRATNTNSANLSWFTAATGGTAIASGVTTPNGTTSQLALPTIPMGTTATQTYYVQDNTIVTGTVGPTSEFSTGTTSDNSAKYNLGQNGILFSPTQDFKINSVQIPLRIASAAGTTNMTFAVTLRVYTASPSPGGTATATTSTISNTVTIPYTATSFALYTFNFTNFTIPASLGSNLILKIESFTSNYANYQFELGNRNGITTWAAMPSTINPNPVTITSSLSGNSVTNTQYFGLYNWNISAVTPCSRTPVRAISNCPTPVTWTSFYLVPQDDNSCKLVWNTANETNNSYFAVERSVDGINFETITTISGGGNRDIASNYFYVDNTPLSGTSYYRITQHDYDGKYSSTGMKPYSSLGLIQVTTYPNPFQSSTTLLVSGANAEVYTYTIYSVNGQLVEQGSGTINQMQTIAETEAKGMYMLTVVTSTDIVTTKIVKQ